MKTAKQKLSEQYVQSVYVIKVKGNNGYVMIDENTTDDIEQARAFQYAEALEYVKGFENTYQIVKYNPGEDTDLESEDELFTINEKSNDDDIDCVKEEGRL